MRVPPAIIEKSAHLLNEVQINKQIQTVNLLREGLFQNECAVNNAGVF